MNITTNLREAADEFALAAAKYRQSNPEKCERYDRLNKAVLEAITRLAKADKPKASGVKPTLEEAIAFGASIDLPRSESESFFDYYEATGWRIGKSAKVMSDWKAALRNWKRRWEERNPGASRLQANGHSEDPEGWKEWIVRTGGAYVPFRVARGYLKDDFNRTH